jgi:hypothetical protein
MANVATRDHFTDQPFTASHQARAPEARQPMSETPNHTAVNQSVQVSL